MNVRNKSEGSSLAITGAKTQFKSVQPWQRQEAHILLAGSPKPGSAPDSRPSASFKWKSGLQDWQALVQDINNVNPGDSGR